MSNQPITIEALNEAKQISRRLFSDLRAVVALRRRVERDASELLSEMALTGGKLVRLRELLPERDFSEVLKRASKHGDANACTSIFNSINRGLSEAKLLCQIFNMESTPSVPTNATTNQKECDGKT